MFYMNGYYSRSADLALVAFTTCLEALFSTVEQELSFRLSLRVAQFLAKTRNEQREYYKEAKKVYKTRSKRRTIDFIAALASKVVASIPIVLPFSNPARATCRSTQPNTS